MEKKTKFLCLTIRLILGILHKTTNNFWKCILGIKGTKPVR